jgi:hypothetical protein
MSELTKEQIKEWKVKLEEGVMFSVGTEIQLSRKGAFINIARFADGKVPSDKHMMHQGHLVPQLFFQEFMKMNADTCLKDVTEDVVTDLMTDGVLYKFICDLFIHAYFKVNYEEMYNCITHWETWKGVLDSVSDSQSVESVDIPTQ